MQTFLNFNSFHHFEQFVESSQLDGGIKFIIQQKLDQNLEEKIGIFQEKNAAKHANFIVSF